MDIKSVRDLVVSQKSMMLGEGVYALTDRFPTSEMFGFRAQAEPLLQSASEIAKMLHALVASLNKQLT